MKLKIGLLAVALLALVSCTNSGGDDESNPDPSSPELSTNACPVLGLNTRIINGTECSESNSPVVEIVLGFSDGRSGVCSGSLIDSEWVLTAAHCFFESPSNVAISSAEGLIDGVRSIVNPDVRITDSAVFNDVALIKLARPVGLRTLPLVASRAPVQGEVINIYGYGSTDGSSTLDTVGSLRSGQMEISEVTTNFIDSAYNGKGSNTCSGDSGGPAIMTVNGQQGIVGLLSSGSLESCQVGDVSRFSNLQSSSNFNFITRFVPKVKVI